MLDHLNLSRIRDASHPSFPLLLGLYTNTFPLEERRHPEELISLLDEERMYFMATAETGQVVGFVLYWDFGDFRFVEHFAVYPEQRGRNAGSRVIRSLSESLHPIILEVEPPTDSLSHRRIGFYQRNGFELLDFAYRQPPYHAGLHPLPMLLMSDKNDWPEEALQKAVGLIHQNVYGTVQ